VNYWNTRNSGTEGRYPSVILTVQQKFELDLPALWRELPPAHLLASDAWRFEWVDELRVPVEHKEALLDSLRYSSLFAMDKTTPGRSWVAVIDPALGVVRALASIVTIELTDVAFPDFWRLGVPDFPVDGVEPWTSQRFEVELAGHPAIVVHDIGAYTFDLNGAVIAERYVGTVFPDAGSTVVQLEILAEDLEAFDDIVAVGNAVLDGLRFAAADLD